MQNSVIQSFSFSVPAAEVIESATKNTDQTITTDTTDTTLSSEKSSSIGSSSHTVLLLLLMISSLHIANRKVRGLMQQWPSLFNLIDVYYYKQY